MIMNMDNVRKIIFRRGEENQIVLEQGLFKHTLFQQQYLSAMDSFMGICLSMKNNPGDDIANIISFCGDRGDGKSSCMRTTRAILQGENLFTYNDSDNEQELLFKHSCSLLESYPVYALNVIDPSFFDKEHNILDLVVSRLFHEAFRDNTPERKTKEQLKERNELISQFNRVKESMSILEKKRREILDNIEDLDRLAESMRLRDNVRNLVNAFLKYRTNQDGKEYKKLLISIDDLDLNVSGGYTMLEQIRKYLSNDQCVILIALKIEQMTKVVQNALYENSGQNIDVVSVEMCRDMAEKYITKMFPTEHRVIMPKVDDIVNYRLYLQESLAQETEHDQDWETIKEAVVSLIFLKTRYLFYNTEHEVNRIIPRNLRSLRHLLATLLRMDDFEKGNLQSKENQSIFKRYFFNEWTNMLPEEQQTLVQDIIRYSDVSTKNHYILTSLFGLLKESEVKSFKWYNAQARAYNISVGDVLFVIQELQETGHAELGNLLFFLQSYYSMMLYEYYDELVGEMSGTNIVAALYDYQKYEWVNHRFKEKEQPVNKHREIYANDERFRGISKLQQFVGGAYFTYEPGELLPVEQINIMDPYTRQLLYTSMPRDIRGLDAVTIFAYMRKYIQENANIPEDSSTNINIGLLSFKLCEFFALTTKMTQTAEESRAGTYRNRSYPYYLSTFKQGNTIVVFDVMAVFSNIINLRFAYDRFNEVLWGTKNKDKSFFELALNQEGSLLKELLKSYQKDANDLKYQEPLRYAYAMGRMASAGIIRNTDVHQSLLAKVRAERESISKNATSGSGYIGRVIDFYKTILNSEITLYGEADTEFEKLYTINYEKLLRPIITLLENIQEINESVFSQLFRSYEEVAHPKNPQGVTQLESARGGRLAELPTFETALWPNSVEGVQTPYLQPIYNELIKFVWNNELDGKFIKDHLSKELRDMIPSRVRQSITEKHSFASADSFMKRLIELIKDYKNK